MSSRSDYLDAMGIDVYVRRDVPTSEVRSAKTVRPQPVAAAVADENPEWRQLEQQVRMCTACELHQSRTQTVFGVGNRDADWLFVGEGPGFEEDRQGEPFVGRAGKLLDKMLAAIGFDRSQVYIANTVKCRPPDNRNPRPEELAACNHYLRSQIDLIGPKLIVALGAVAANTLLETQVAVGRLRGKVHRYGVAEIPLIVTYHPAYLLRSPQQKKASWEDLQLAQRVAAGEQPVAADTRS